MAVDTKLAMHFKRCVKNLTSLKITISKSEENEEKFLDVRRKVGDVPAFGEVMVQGDRDRISGSFPD